MDASISLTAELRRRNAHGASRRFILLAAGFTAFCLGGGPLAVTAGERWRQTRVLPAPEAHQAAAADDRFVYAISSTEVAKYDRSSGERVAVSTGEAKHLNSGFVWNGRVFCAHSNYPRKPEQSDIRVLDPESMRLTTFHDFGSFDGSLTWVLRHEEHWWCNFAHYGDDNGRTVLVKFDGEWREQARWTYPATVIRELGRYSLSGGVFSDGDLLVTGHDDRVLFRLRVPTEGKELAFLGRQPAPFTGQGIAHDPQTGGLVGINRGKRLIVFAEEEPPRPLRLRVLSYNIHHGEGIDGKLDLERIARTIRSAEPDLVSLQEVDRGVARSNRVDQPAELAKLTKMHVAFEANIRYQGGDYGNAVLSRFPIRRHTNHALPRFDDGEQRGVLEVELDLPDGERLLFLSTHLDHRAGDRERLASAGAINELIVRREGRPALLAGDLNDLPDSAVLREFGREWVRANEEILPTIPVSEPARQIDYILYRPAEAWDVVEARVLDEAVASDHRAILAVLERRAAVADAAGIGADAESAAP